MICDHIRESLASYAIGTLSSTEAASVEQHLAGCDACRADVEEFAALRPLLARITADDVLGETAPVPDLATRAIAKRRRSSSSPLGPAMPSRWTAQNRP